MLIDINLDYRSHGEERVRGELKVGTAVGWLIGTICSQKQYTQCDCGHSRMKTPKHIMLVSRYVPYRQTDSPSSAFRKSASFDCNGVCFAAVDTTEITAAYARDSSPAFGGRPDLCHGASNARGHTLHPRARVAASPCPFDAGVPLRPLLHHHRAAFVPYRDLCACRLRDRAACLSLCASPARRLRRLSFSDSPVPCPYPSLAFLAPSFQTPSHTSPSRLSPPASSPPPQ
jgi:hypothetical protein